MSVNDEPTASRQFVASCSVYSPWVGAVSVTNHPPAYEISAADWLTLVQKLGLASNLEDTAT